MNKEEVVKKFTDVPIGKTNLSNDIFVSRVLEKDDLKHFLYNIYGPKDETLTKDGLMFLEEYYGLDRVADLILEEKRAGLDYSFGSKEEIIDWLNKSAL